MPEINPKRLKVAELKVELEKRGIEISKGLKKPDLVALLMSALESEAQEKLNFSEIEESENSQAETSKNEEASSAPEKTEPAKEPEPAAEPEKPAEEPDVPKVEDEVAPQAIEEKPAAPEEVKEPQAEPEELRKPTEQKSAEVAQPAEDVPKEAEAEVPVKVEHTPDPELLTPAERAKPADEEAKPADEEAKPAEEKSPESTEAPKTEEAPDAQTTTEQKSNEETEPMETSLSEKPATEQNRKRKMDDHHDRQNRWEERYQPPEEEPADDFDDSLVVLDVYNSDLHFKVFQDRLSGQSFTLEGFAYMWGGARATYGVTSGKVYFEIKIVEEIPVMHVRPDEPMCHAVQVGFSSNTSSLQLGDGPKSFAYTSEAKKATNDEFTDYGETFTVNDVVGCYLDMTDETNFTITFTKNGTKLDTAFTAEKSLLNGDALFPHVLVKNMAIECNFGSLEETFSTCPEELADYKLISAVPLEELVRATKAPATRAECEALMMFGLPASGKTYYCESIANDKPEKKFNLLGTSYILDRMKLNGVERIKTEGARWDVLMNTASNCLNRLLEVACRKRRNYIIDQTNVYASAQRRKMRPFEGFQRRAVVVVPSDEDYKSRCSKRSKDKGKEVPDNAVLEMKGSMALPEVGDLFDEVIYAELNKEESAKQVEDYKTEAKNNLPPPDKRFRGGGYGRGGWGNRGGMDRGGMFGGRGGGGGMFRGGFNRGGGPGFGGRGNYGFGGRGDFRGGRGGGFGNNRGGGGYGGMNRGGWNNNNMGGGRNNNNYGGNRNRNQRDNQKNNRGGGGNNQNKNQNFIPSIRNNRNSFGSNNRSFNKQNNSFNNQKNNSFGQNNQQLTGGQSFQQNKPANNFQTNNFMAQAGAAKAAVGTTPIPQQPQSQAQGYQQAFGQNPDYSQQWAQYYQQQAQQNQQYQNYYANYQQYYNQQMQQQKK